VNVRCWSAYTRKRLLRAGALRLCESPVESCGRMRTEIVDGGSPSTLSLRRQQFSLCFQFSKTQQSGWSASWSMIWDTSTKKGTGSINGVRVKALHFANSGDSSFICGIFGDKLIDPTPVECSHIGR
jgi:hypothetical protein